MSSRLSTRVQSTLSRHGIDVIPSLTGTSRSGIVSISDPLSFDRSKKILNQRGIGTRRRTASTMDVFMSDTLRQHLDPEENLDSPDDPTLDSLVSSWREFAKRSSDNGFRKAALNIKGGSLLETARQIAETTMRFAHRSPAMRRFAKFLMKAVKTKDEKSIKSFLDRTVVSNQKDKPFLRDPNKPLRNKDEKVDIFAYTPASRNASPQALFDSAQQFLMDYCLQNKLSSTRVDSLKTDPGKVYDAWRQNAPEDLPNHAYDAAWIDAVNAVSNHIGTERKRTSALWAGHESGVEMVLDFGNPKDINLGFMTASSFDQAQKQSVKDLVADLIDFYVVDDRTGEPLHPSQISHAQVRSFLRNRASQVPADEVISYLDRITKRIPSRYESSKRKSGPKMPWEQNVSFNDIFGPSKQPVPKVEKFFIWNKTGSGYRDSDFKLCFSWSEAATFDTRADAQAFLEVNKAKAFKTDVVKSKLVKVESKKAVRDPLILGGYGHYRPQPLGNEKWGVVDELGTLVDDGYGNLQEAADAANELEKEIYGEKKISCETPSMIRMGRLIKKN